MEHDPLAARGLGDALKLFPDVHPLFVRDADLESGLRRVEESTPELVLLSIGYVTTSVISFVRTVKKRHPNLSVIVIAGDDRLMRVSDLIRAGADSYLHKGIAPAIFDSSLSRSLHGEHLAVVPNPDSWLSQIVNMRKKITNRFSPGKSTHRTKS